MKNFVLTKIKKLREDAKLPDYATSNDSGADIFMPENEPAITINPGERILIKTGLAIALPERHEAQVRSKSGLALNSGIMVLNSPGTIDEKYRGEIGVILYNTGSKPKVFEGGDKIAQIVIKPVYQSDFIVVDELEKTDRGEGAYGSTGR